MTTVPGHLAQALADRYRIERELGQGGMATVYLAEDIKHHRKVAIKVLRPELAAVIGAERFLTEIKTTANLQHPHILALHDSGEAGGMVFYVMPYVQGESLRDRLNRVHQLPVDEAVRIAREVADALDYAHRHGVIHRDIKPENVLLHDGRVQVADFGIALAVSRSDGGSRMTETGMSLGTPHYMAPEQAMGEREITPRADIYALGCMTYEMLCGEPPFSGPTAQAIIARMMTEEPRSLTLQRKTIPPHVEAAVRTALEKLPADRMATAAEFAAALVSPGYVGRSGTAAHSARQADAGARARFGWPALALVASGILLAALGVLAGVRLARPHAKPSLAVQFALALPDSARYVDTFGRSVAVSPDGSALVYSGGTVGQHHLFLRRLDEEQPTPVLGTDGAYMPFFSPDGEWLGFVANQRLMKVRLSGGSPIMIVQLLGNIVSGASWGPRDEIVLEDVSGLSRIAASGGRLEELAPLDSLSRLIEWPSFLPDGNAVLGSVSSNDGKDHLAVITVPGGRVSLFQDVIGTDPRFLAPDTVLWLSPEGVMMAATFDPGRRHFTGKPVPVVEGVVEEQRGAKIAIGPGIVVRVTGTSQRVQLLRLDRRGVSRVELPDGPGYASPRFSPDGRRIAFTTDPLGGELWVVDRVRGTRQRLAMAAAAIGPEWSSDGRRLVFGYQGASNWDVYTTAADGSSQADSLVAGPRTEFPVGWTPDGTFVFWRATQNRGDIFYRDSTGAEHTFVSSTADERSPVLSPDGHWLVYVSDESGRREVYVRPFPSGSGRWQISSDGGIEPRWSKHGHEIVYRDRGWFLAVPVVPGPGFAMGRVDSLFQGTYLLTGSRAQYDVSPDGSEFLVVGAPAEARTLSVTLNPFGRVLTKP
jgi:Tol biopolymer transport system component/tRNA A-37 threonylcarbamoyl transferase component Bud32